MKPSTICIVGGTGFVGSHLAARLAASGYQLRLLTRHPQRHRDLSLLPGVSLHQADVFDDAALAEHFEGCDAVISLVGILNEKGRDGSGFRRAHVELPRKIVEVCRKVGIKRLIHMSALNAATISPSFYLRTKGEGEKVIIAAGRNGMAVTRICPSVIFGPDDSFLNRFTALLRLSPIAFPLACAEARFAPVYVGDVVEAFAVCLDDPTTIGERYELCGPESYTLKELVEYAAESAGLKRLIIGLPDALSKLQASILEWLPGKPFSRDNYNSLQIDSICKQDGLAALGVSPTRLKSFRPGANYQKSDRARYDDHRRRAGRHTLSE
ncbi:epimerase [Solemya pervernicosa gill symbiont]|uniref:Epimerase n=2 Tax=Gammaproteobacteria incertae sedis TaxID=118884 RepID=A0A1T2KZZ2_9GAMM|nr:complex I NDUFA9 subunit family protein [Candidatus Reidiella endopervernicosa]OOZ38423.1 epimerase [Solemya pervernicosa gill symbiont]QKQ24955.1 complex I NDUFA9 subunit family protein [Candidatus Reidiella endopervernicosa]